MLFYGLEPVKETRASTRSLSFRNTSWLVKLHILFSHALAMNRPIILVTGANAGLGLGVCERLLIQLSSTMPSDSGMLDDPKHNVASTPFLSLIHI